MIELAAFGIVALFITIRMRFGPEPLAFLRRFALLALASLLVEDSSIHAYGFYYYDNNWSLFLDQVPLAIIVIWPIVILSSWELARSLLGKQHRLVPLIGGLLVLADASLIEPVSVHTGLWRWTEPGLFSVPPIGVLGWAFHAAFCMVVLQLSDRRRKASLEALVFPVSGIGTHLLLLASWWALFRWVNVPWNAWPAVGALWIGSLALAVHSHRTNARARVEPRELLSRIPAAVFFFVLLGLYGRNEPALVLFVLAFAPPYLSLMQMPAAWRRAA